MIPMLTRYWSVSATAADTLLQWLQLMAKQGEYDLIEEMKKHKLVYSLLILFLERAEKKQEHSKEQKRFCKIRSIKDIYKCKVKIRKSYIWYFMLNRHTKSIWVDIFHISIYIYFIILFNGVICYLCLEFNMALLL